jgi:hypothetical protein
MLPFLHDGVVLAKEKEASMFLSGVPVDIEIFRF